MRLEIAAEMITGCIEKQGLVESDQSEVKGYKQINVKKNIAYVYNHHFIWDYRQLIE